MRLQNNFEEHLLDTAVLSRIDPLVVDEEAGLHSYFALV